MLFLRCFLTLSVFFMLPLASVQATIFVTDRRAFEAVLRIDDAVGSGATMHEVACQLKKQGVAKQVIGLAITGSATGFDVISEV